jgi:hypothetical protein
MDKWCLVSFFIDKKYYNSDWYDVVCIDASHIIRMPYQYNRNVLHDKWHNACTFNIKRKHVALASRRGGNC